MNKRLILILLLALLLRLATLGTQIVISTDSATYLRLAENMFSGVGYKDIHGEFCKRPPLYSILVGLVRFIVRDTEKCGKIVSIFFGMGIVYLIYRIGLVTFGNPVALVASGIASIHPFLIQISTLVLREALYLFLLLAAVLFTIQAIISGRRRYPFLIGIFLGLAYLTRIETILYLGSILISLALLKPVKKPGTLVIIILIFLMIITPYLIVVKTATGKVSIGGETNKLGEMINAVHKSGDNIASRGKILFSNYVRNLNRAYLIMLPMIFPPLLLFFFAIGTVVNEHKSDKTKFIILTVFMFLPLLFHPFHWINPRYFLVFIGLGLVFAAMGIIYFSERWEDVFPVLKGKLIFASLLVILISFLPKMTQPFREDKYYRHWIEHKAMGLWMKENIGGEPRIISKKPFVPFYAGGVEVFLPSLEPESLYTFAVKNKAGYLVADERSSRWYKYKKLELFLAGEPPKGFRLINEMEKRPGYKIRLFEIIEGL